LKSKEDPNIIRSKMFTAGSPVMGAQTIKLKPSEVPVVGVTMQANKYQANKAKLPPPPKSEGISQGMEIKKPDLQMLLQDHAATQRALADERRNSDKKIAEERETAHWKEERLHDGYTSKLRDLESQIRALLGIIGDLRQQNDQLRIDIAIADVRNRTSAAPVPPRAPAGTPAAPYGSVPLVNPQGVPLRMSPFVSQAKPMDTIPCAGSDSSNTL
jgi:hypothetical protein